MQSQRKLLSLKKPKPRTEAGESSARAAAMQSSSSDNITFIPTPGYLRLLEDIKGQPITPFPPSQLKLPSENDPPPVHSDNDSDDSADPPTPQWTPLPPPDIQYNLWHCMTPLLGNFAENYDTPADTDAQVDEATDNGEVSEEIVSEGDDYMDISIEDEQALNALMQEDFDLVSISSQESHQPQVQLVHTDPTHTVSPPSTVGDSDRGGNPSVCAAMSGPSSMQDTTSLSCTDDEDDVVITSYSPPDMYEITDNSFDNISMEDLYRIDKSVDVYIERSPDSSSSDERFPKLNTQTFTLSRASPKVKVPFVPVSVDNSSSRPKYSHQPNVTTKVTNSHQSTSSVSISSSCSGVKTKEHQDGQFSVGHIKKAALISSASSISVNSSHSTNGSQRNIAAAANSLAVMECPMCGFKYPSWFTQEKADEHFANCLRLEDLTD